MRTRSFAFFTVLLLLLVETKGTQGLSVKIVEPTSSWWTIGKNEKFGDVALEFVVEGASSAKSPLTVRVLKGGEEITKMENFDGDEAGIVVPQITRGLHTFVVELWENNRKISLDAVSIDVEDDAQDDTAPLIFRGDLSSRNSREKIVTAFDSTETNSISSDEGGEGEGGADTILEGKYLTGCDGICRGRPVGKLLPERRAAVDRADQQFNFLLQGRGGEGKPTGWGGDGLLNGGENRDHSPYPLPPSPHPPPTLFIITPCFNVEEWIWRNIRSLRLQRWKSFKVVIIDDASTDNTAALAKREIGGDDRFTLVLRKTRQLALANTMFAIKLANPKPEDVVVILDGDDWLFDENALGKIVETYIRTECWISYGTFLEFPTATIPDWIKDFPQWVFQQKAFRAYNWTSTNPRTFKHKLFELVNDDDLRFPQNKTYFSAAADVALMMPMLEMAGDRIVRIPDLLVVYNIANTLNDYKANFPSQVWTSEHIRFMPKYARLPGSLSPNKPLPTVNITSPADEAQVSPNFAIEVVVNNFFMPEEGHLDIYVNERLIHQVNHSSAYIALKQIEPGPYHIIAELVFHSDHGWTPRGETGDFYSSIDVDVAADDDGDGEVAAVVVRKEEEEGFERGEERKDEL